MTKNIEYFETCVPNNLNNKGRIKIANGGSMKVKGRGTVTQKLEDEEGVVYKVKIKDIMYAPKLDRCLLSPHHVAQKLEKEPGTSMKLNEVQIAHQ